MIDSVRHRKQKASIELSCRLAQRQCAQTNGCFFFLQTITSHSTSTRPRGARHSLHGFVLSPKSFQSTRPRGARQDAHAASPDGRDFNPRARVGRDKSRFHKTALRLNFNPRARVGRDLGYFQVVRDSDISIHAPAWGATPCLCSYSTAHRISIHAPAWGATRFAGALYAPRDISIHAPAWGATASARASRLRCRFQSTRPRGARHIIT